MPFIPPSATTAIRQPERIAIIGPPGGGKSTSLLTFPDLIVLDVDRKAPQGVLTIPAWNPDWTDEILGPKGRTVNKVANHRDAIKKFIRENHDKFTPEQTFAIDSWSFLMDACDNQTSLEDSAGYANTTKGQHNDFWFWEQKLEFTREIIKYLRSMKCRVVVTFHEVEARGPDGKLNGKIRPVMSGQYKDQLLGGFTNVWRMRANLFETNRSGMIARNEDGTPKATPGFYWQLKGDSVVDLMLDPNITRVLAKYHEGDRIRINLNAATGIVTGGYQTLLEYFAREQREQLQQTQNAVTQ